MEKTLLFTIERSVVDMSLLKKKENDSWKPIKKAVTVIFGFLVGSGLLLTAVTAIFSNIVKDAVDEKITTQKGDMEEQLKEQKDDLIRSFDDKFDGISTDLIRIEGRIDRISDDFYAPKGNVFPSDTKAEADFIKYANLSYTTLDSPINENNATFLNCKSVVAYSPAADMKYTVEQVADARILLSYTENGQEVYFWGQLSENGSWDGNCIVNIYKNDELQLITDAVYDDGDLLSCKQVFPYTTSGDKIDVWGVSKRTVKDNFSSGETKYIVRHDNYTKEFTLDTVQSEDIWGADAFANNLTGYQEGYYFGNISNGRFNDDTSTAYMVKYFEDGSIKTLYVGNFRNGQFHDNTGNAWMIGKDGIDKPYCYYCGPFVRGEAKLDPKLWEDGITQERIDEIIEGCSFDCPLKW